MKLRRLQQLAGLTETITDDSNLNSRIESGLNSVSAEDRAGILDALEILYNSAEPISARAWADQVKALHPEQDPAVILTQTRRLFPWLAQRTADNLYKWNVVNELDPTYSAIHSQITLTDIAKELMKTMGTFTLDELANRVSQQMGVPVSAIRGWVQHLLQTMPAKITQANGQYTYSDAPGPTRASNIDLMRRLAGNSDDNV